MADAISLSDYRRADLGLVVASGMSVYSAPGTEGCSAVFAPCLDPNCERPCGARRTIPEINLDIRREAGSLGFWTLAGIGLALTIIFTGAAVYGMTRDQRAYHAERI